MFIIFSPNGKCNQGVSELDCLLVDKPTEYEATQHIVSLGRVSVHCLPVGKKPDVISLLKHKPEHKR